MVAAEAATAKCVLLETELAEAHAAWQRKLDGFQLTLNTVTASDMQWHSKFQERVDEEGKWVVDGGRKEKRVVRNKAVQTVGPKGNRKYGTQTDVSRVQAPLKRPTYAEVTTQAAGVRGPGSPPMPAGRRTRLRPPPSRPSCGGSIGGGSGRVVGHVVVIHGVLCEQGIQDILAEARGLQLRYGQRVVGARWLVNEHRHLGMCRSSMVVFFSADVVLEKAD